MGFAWFHAEERRYRRTPTLLTGANPTKLSPPDEVDTVTDPLLARSPDARPLSWLALLPSCRLTEANPLSERRPHLRGVPAKSPLLADRVAAFGLPVAPLGFPRLRAFTRRPAGDCGHRSAHHPVRSPNRSWVPPDHIPTEVNLQYRRSRRPPAFLPPLMLPKQPSR